MRMPGSKVRVKKTCRGHVFRGRGLMNLSNRTEPNKRAGRYRKINVSILHHLLKTVVYYRRFSFTV